MADHFTKFSCVLDVGSAKNALRATQIRDELASEIDRDEDVSLGFDIAFDAPPSNGRIILYSEDFGETEHVIMFVRRCAESFGLTGRWGFDWAYDCSKARLDAFGGGACLLDLGSGEVISTLTTSEWLERELAGAGEQADANDSDR
jgi:hypothetical protein